jgi:hypothetical protein
LIIGREITFENADGTRSALLFSAFDRRNGKG